MATTIGSLDLNAFSDLYSDSTQYFWFESNASATYGAGAHVTLVPDTSFISNPTGQNILMNTDGFSIRNGLLPMMTLDNDSLDFNVVDTTAGTYNKVASFGTTTTIGDQGGAHLELAPTRMYGMNSDLVDYFEIKNNAIDVGTNYEYKQTVTLSTTSTVITLYGAGKIYDSQEIGSFDDYPDAGKIGLSMHTADDFYPFEFTFGESNTQTYSTEDNILITVSYNGDSEFTLTSTDDYECTPTFIYSFLEIAPSYSFGNDNHSNNPYSVTIGANNRADSRCAIAIGGSNRADEEYAVAIGLGNRASGYCSYAEGGQTRASGHYAHAEGSSTVAGYTAHAEGYNTIASGQYSHAEGYKTSADGTYSHAQGFNTIANTQASFVSGVGTVSDTKATTVIGKYNQTADNIGYFGSSDIVALPVTIGEGQNFIYSTQGDSCSYSYTNYYLEKFNISLQNLLTQYPNYKIIGFQLLSYDTDDGFLYNNEIFTDGTTITSFDQQITVRSSSDSYSKIYFNSNKNEGEYIDKHSGDFYVLISLSGTNTINSVAEPAFIIGNGSNNNNRSNALTVDWSGNVDAAGALRAKTEQLTPTISIAPGTTGTTVRYKVRRFGNVVTVYLTVRNTKSVAVGGFIYQATLSGIPLPSDYVSTATYYGGRCLAAVLSSGGVVYLRNTHSAAFAVGANDSISFSFTYVID